MRTITRTGVTLSVIAALALYGVQLVAALAVALGVVLAGILSGLFVAKWLERDWYGRQFDAGARAGGIACGVGGLAALLYLLGQGPRTLPELAARSHIFGLSLAPLVRALSPLGWAGVDIVVMFGAMALGIVLAGVMTWVFGWGKSGRAVRVVAQARLAAQALQRSEARASATAGPRSIAPGPQLYATGAPLASTPLDQSEWEGLGLPGASAPAMPRPWRPAAGSGRGTAAPQATAGPAPQVTPEPHPPVAPRPPTIHRPSDARSARETLSDEARSALANWEDELDAFDGMEGLEGAEGVEGDDATAADETTQKVRNANPSTFLTAPPPVRPRRRKRQDTGDWLC